MTCAVRAFGVVEFIKKKLKYEDAGKWERGFVVRDTKPKHALFATSTLQSPSDIATFDKSDLHEAAGQLRRRYQI